MKHPSRARSAVGRRDLLRLAALAPAAAALTTACGPDTQQKQDQLETLAKSAESDTALARAVAKSHPDLAEPAGSVASARGDHAKALRQEIDRVNPPDPDKPKAPPPRAKAPSSSAQATSAMAEGLRTTQNKTAGLVPSLRPYRAGLVGSISASCASLLEVLA